MKYLLIVLIILLYRGLFGATVQDTLYLNRESVLMGGYLTNRCVFNDSVTFNKQNSFIDLNSGDILELTIINNDTIVHDFTLVNGNALGSINGGNSDTYSIPFPTFGTYGVAATDPIGNLLGAFCVIRVGLQTEKSFIWNICEMNDTLSLEIGNGLVNTIPVNYRPNISTINGLDFPMTTTDTLGSVNGMIGDTIYISIVNSGNMIHTLHFHGFHFVIKQISIRNEMLNWEKDSFPLLPDETATIRLVPDKEGMYPVHDHNLISVLTLNNYPGGMITMLEIMP